MSNNIVPRRLFSAWICFVFIFINTNSSLAEISFILPLPGQMVALSAPFEPMLLKGAKFNLKKPFQLEFLVDLGENASVQDHEKINSLVRYFLAGLTTPDEDYWVNLSPYESDRIVAQGFGETAMGRDMLAQDYLLKQITSSLIYPESELGKKYWQLLYQKVYEKYGVIEIPVETFNKVWIVPDVVKVYESERGVYVTEASLKVLTDVDYLAAQSHNVMQSQDHKGKTVIPAQAGISTEVIRSVVIPVLEQEVNEGTHFAPLRQMYHSLILATWYKKKLKNSILAQIYVDQQKETGSVIEAEEVDVIYQQYVHAFKQGVFDFVKEEYSLDEKQDLPRHYFSGGTAFFHLARQYQQVSNKPNNFSDSDYAAVAINFRFQNKNTLSVISKDSAMKSSPAPSNPRDLIVNSNVISLRNEQQQLVQRVRNILQVNPYAFFFKRRWTSDQDYKHYVHNQGWRGIHRSFKDVREEFKRGLDDLKYLPKLEEIERYYFNDFSNAFNSLISSPPRGAMLYFIDAVAESKMQLFGSKHASYYVLGVVMAHQEYEDLRGRSARFEGFFMLNEKDHQALSEIIHEFPNVLFYVLSQPASSNPLFSQIKGREEHALFFNTDVIDPMFDGSNMMGDAPAGYYPVANLNDEKEMVTLKGWIGQDRRFLDGAMLTSSKDGFLKLIELSEQESGDGSMVFNRGGVDLTVDQLKIQFESKGVSPNFDIDEAMVTEMRQNIRGLEPVIISSVLMNPRVFLSDL